MEPEVCEPRRRLFTPDLVDQTLDGGGKRVGGSRIAGRDGACAQHAHPMVLFCQVRQMEITGEGAGDLFGANGRERVDELLSVFDRRVVLLLVGIDRELSQPLDVVEQLRAAGFGQNPAEKCTEESNVGAQCGVDFVANAAAAEIGVASGRVSGNRHRPKLAPPC
jgi:hypothetical protein